MKTTRKYRRTYNFRYRTIVESVGVDVKRREGQYDADQYDEN